jgi:carbonic anhydrase/acetyltransferase-like protein (isoleucine patch superfamily)
MIYSFENRVPQLAADCYVAESAQVIGSVTLGEAASVWFGTVLRGDIEPVVVGARSNIQENSVAHTSRGHPVVLGDDVTVGHNVTLHGCTIGNNCLIGMGAVLLDGCEIGDNCIIGAGSLVGPRRKVPAGSLALGNPLRVVRSLSAEAIDQIRGAAARYVDLQARYRKGGLQRILENENGRPCF